MEVVQCHRADQVEALDQLGSLGLDGGQAGVHYFLHERMHRQEEPSCPGLAGHAS